MQKPCRSLGKWDYLLERCREILRLNQQADQAYQNIEILKFMAWVFDEQGKYQEAYGSGLEGLNIAFTTDNRKVQIELSQRLVRYAVLLGNLPKASEHYEHAKTVTYNMNDPEIKDETFYQLGRMAWVLNKYDESLEYYRIAKDIAHEKGDLTLKG